MKSRLWKCAVAAGSVTLAAMTINLVGCATHPSSGSSSAGVASASAKKALPLHSGAQLWAENCGRCHNIRSPDSLSDAQWEVVALHMRIRANLTAEEHRQILAFLKSAH